MKKQYVKPDMKVVKTQRTILLAGSDGYGVRSMSARGLDADEALIFDDEGIDADDMR